MEVMELKHYRAEGINITLGTDNDDVFMYLERFADAILEAYHSMDAEADEVDVKVYVRTVYAVNFDNILAINVADHCEWVSEVLRNFLDMERIIREEMDMPEVNIGLEMKALRGIYDQNPFEMENGW